MNKTDLVNVVAAETGFTKKDVDTAVSATLKAITAALKEGDKVQLIGFGTFEVKATAEREGRNPKTGETIKIPTGIRVKIEDGWWLGCLPRSGLGFKYRLQLNNTLGVIDSDYYYSDNEGHIFAKITNDGKEGRHLKVKAGESFMQGIFIPYGVTYSDNVENVRNGGMGSTGK